MKRNSLTPILLVCLLLVVCLVWSIYPLAVIRRAIITVRAFSGSVEVKAQVHVTTSEGPFDTLPTPFRFPVFTESWVRFDATYNGVSQTKTVEITKTTPYYNDCTFYFETSPPGTSKPPPPDDIPPPETSNNPPEVEGTPVQQKHWTTQIMVAGLTLAIICVIAISRRKR